MTESTYCSLSEAAEMLGYTKNHVRTHILGRKVAAIKRSGKILVDAASLAAFKRRQAEEEAAAFAPLETPVPRPLRDLYTVQQTKEMLSLSNTTFYKLAKEGRLQTVKIGTKTLVPISAIKAFLAEISA